MRAAHLAGGGGEAQLDAAAQHASAVARERDAQLLQHVQRRQQQQVRGALGQEDAQRSAVAVAAAGARLRLHMRWGTWVGKHVS